MGDSADIEKDVPQGVAAHVSVQDKNEDKKSSDTVTRAPVKWFGVELPAPVSNTIHAVHDVGQHWRSATIQALPRFLVNHSSNVIGTTQLVGEVMMFKANGTVFFPEVTDPIKKAELAASPVKNAWHYISSPLISVYKSIFKNTGSRKLHARDLVSVEFWKHEVAGFLDLEKAALRDSGHSKALLINRWQARATFAGLVGMLFAAVMPDVKDTDEDIEKRVTLRHQHPIAYVGKTIGEALWFPVATVMEIGKKIVTFGKSNSNNDIGEYKRQFTGLSLTIAGLCSFLSGFRNVKGNSAGNQTYAKNTAHSMGGMITAIAGSQLLLAVGSDVGWERFGAIQWLRMAFLPKSITNRYKPDAMGRLDKGRHHYVAGQALLQSANTESFLFGGAEVRDDGSVVDKKTLRETTKNKAKASKVGNLDLRHNIKDIFDGATVKDVPDTTISDASAAERAMPERVEAEKADKEAVVV